MLRHRRRPLKLLLQRGYRHLSVGTRRALGNGVEAPWIYPASTFTSNRYILSRGKTMAQETNLTSAESRDLFGNNQMRLIGSSIVSADALSQLLSSQQAIGLSHVALAMHPPGFNRVQPGTLRRQQKGQDSHTNAGLLDLLVLSPDPRANSLTLMPGGIIEDSRASGSSLA